MAKRVSIEIFDDTDGSPAEQTVPFGLDGVSYEIDLSAPNAEELREALTPYVSAARRTGGRRIKVAVGQATTDTTTETEAATEYTATHDIRNWARQNGHEVANRGRIPASIVDAYHASRKTENSGPSRKNRAQSTARPKSTRSK
ncbi:Lsr2 family protein [Amycolatopsis balhimycina DSM 5908]|uniref:Lsr2 family protein n=1 Tax=Amycolatopsis balhimycina DSM 5908 TaxID=1081091 RepID=A0A428WBR3_AMYBA|nr:Lsr2 family protein [Amycolatopsis balhimycina]RSM40404.1 Lsr2 family protein [Amycolatopsis balhimycina DSM 5908]